MTLETARAILNSCRNDKRTFLTGHEESERLAFEQRLKRLRAEPMTWKPLSEFVGAVSSRRGRWA